jgi:hypothetical protein
MAYDESLAQRVSEILVEVPDFEEKKLFGGVGYLINGNMACGVVEEDLVVRVGPDAYTKTLSLPHTHPFDFTGRPMKGWVMVDCDGHENQEILTAWVQRGVNFASSLPAK